MRTERHHAPHDCPVCGQELLLTGLGCEACGTQLSGSFAQCEFCALDDEDREVLRVFLASRGNTKEVERHLDVSYPTARARIDRLLGHLGLREDGSRPVDRRRELLDALARGELSVEDARAELDALGAVS